MSRRAAINSQADIARILRAYRNEGFEVRTRLMPDGSTAFEPYKKDDVDDGSKQNSRSKEIVL